MLLLDFKGSFYDSLCWVQSHSLALAWTFLKIGSTAVAFITAPSHNVSRLFQVMPAASYPWLLACQTWTVSAHWLCQTQAFQNHHLRVKGWLSTMWVRIPTPFTLVFVLSQPTINLFRRVSWHLPSIFQVDIPATFLALLVLQCEAKNCLYFLDGFFALGVIRWKGIANQVKGWWWGESVYCKLVTSIHHKDRRKMYHSWESSCLEG